MSSPKVSYGVSNAYSKHSGIPAYVDPARRFQHTRKIFDNAKLKAMGNLGIFVLQKLDNSTQTGEALANSLKTKWQRVTTNRKHPHLEPTLFKRFEFPKEIYNFDLLESESDIEIPINKKTGEPIKWTPRKLLTWKDSSKNEDKPGRYFTDYATITFLPSGLELRIFPSRNRTTRKIIPNTYNFVIGRRTPTSHSSWDALEDTNVKQRPTPLVISSHLAPGASAATSASNGFPEEAGVGAGAGAGVISNTTNIEDETDVSPDSINTELIKASFNFIKNIKNSPNVMHSKSDKVSDSNSYFANPPHQMFKTTKTV